MLSFLSNPVITLSLGALLSFLISQYFYKRNLKSSLTPFVQFTASPLIGINQSLRDELKFFYKDTTIENLLEVQYLIANTGDKPIREPIKPLTLTLPKNNEILDFKTLFISPEGRELNLSINNSKTCITYDLPLLNSGEFFITKLLINGNPKLDDIKFNITAEELPPQLEPKRLPIDSLVVHGKKKIRFDGSLFFIGLGMLAFSLSVFSLGFRNLTELPNIFDLGVIKFATSLSFLDTSVLISFFPSILLIVLSIMFLIGSFTDFSFPKREKKFVIPEDKEQELLRVGYAHEFIYFKR